MTLPVIVRPDRSGWCKTHQISANLENPEGRCEYCRIGACANPCDIVPFCDLVRAIDILLLERRHPNPDLESASRKIAEWFGAF